jgi:hypothetical protein
MQQPKYKIGDLVIETEDFFKKRIEYSDEAEYRACGIILDVDFIYLCTLFDYTNNEFCAYYQHNLDLISSYGS